MQRLCYAEKSIVRLSPNVTWLMKDPGAIDEDLIEAAGMTVLKESNSIT